MCVCVCVCVCMCECCVCVYVCVCACEHTCVCVNIYMLARIWLVGWYILFYFARMNRHCCLLAWTSGLSKLSQKDEERKEILHESVKHAILYKKIFKKNNNK